MSQVDLSRFSNKWYKPGGIVKRVMWYCVNIIFFRSPFFLLGFVKICFLKIFGCKIGRGVVIKPNVSIKYPWFLEIGNNVWIGEGVWIDNLCQVKIGDNVCISQGAYIMTGSHDHSKVSFDLIIRPVIIEDGAWIGAKSIILPGSMIKTHAVISAGAVFSGTAKPYSVYIGNPATFAFKRTIS